MHDATIAAAGSLWRWHQAVLTAAMVAFVLAFAALIVPSQGFAQETTQQSLDEALKAVQDAAEREGTKLVVVERTATTPTEAAAAPAEAARLEKAVIAVERAVAIAINTFPQIGPAISSAISDRDPDDPSNVGGLTLLLTLIALVVAFAAEFFLRRRTVSALDVRMQSPPQTRAEQLGLGLARFVADVACLALFAVLAMVVVFIATAPDGIVRGGAVAIVNAVVLWRAFAIMFGTLFQPGRNRYRVLRMADDDANNIFKALLALGAFVCVFAAGIGWLTALGMPAEAERVLTVTVRLVSTLGLVVIVIVHRKAITAMLFGESDPENDPLWQRFARAAWAPALIVYFVAAWAVAGVRNILDLGFDDNLVAGPVLAAMVAILTYAVLVLIIDRHFSQPLVTVDLGEGETVERPLPKTTIRQEFHDLFSRCAGILAAFAWLVALLLIWGVSIFRADHPLVQVLGLLVVAFGAYLAYNATRIWFDHKIAEETPEGAGEAGEEGMGTGASRLSTLLPIFRNFILLTIIVLSVMVLLAELGVNIAPLFAGAGVVGLAVGFGAQTLIRDIFSGAFFLLDDAFRKGEYVEVSGTMGSVERIMIRSMQLRHHNGPLHTIPFGEITQLTNYSRDWVVMKLPIRLPFDVDIEKVRKLVKSLGREMASDPELADMFLEPPKSQGVVDIDDSAMILRIKFMTRPGNQFIARRHVFTRLQQMFAREGIRFADRRVTVHVDTEGQVDEEEKAKALAAAAAAVSKEQTTKPAAR
ncbi:MAG: mechanosensitive ion channel family protein [Pseudomonadota bacterium]